MNVLERVCEDLRKPHAAVVLAGLAVAGCLFLLVFVPAPTLREWTREDAFFEIGTVVGYWLAAAMCLHMRRQDFELYEKSAVLLFLCGARELDWHKAFTVDSILKSNYYIKVDAPLLEKWIAAGVVLAIAVLVGYYLLHYADRFRRSVRAREGAGISLATLLGLLVLTKIVDRLLNVLKDDYGMGVPAWATHLQTALEEPLEFCIPLFALLALYQAYAANAAPPAEDIAEAIGYRSTVR